MPMRTHVDWLTFTLTPRYKSTYPDRTTQEEIYQDAIEHAFIATFGVAITETVFGGAWDKKERSRAPYVDAWGLGERGITVYASPTLNHLCVEISGQGCEALISSEELDRVLVCVADRVTRIDVASDIKTATRPTEFVATINHERMRASGYQNSESGETCYVGSQKSDRYARVYRYNPPHPRADLLRIEHVFRRDYAKKVASELINASVEAIAASSGLAFGWAHETWDVAQDKGADISIIHEKRATGKTVFWLIDSCASAFKRLCADGTIKDPEAFLREHFLNAD